MIQTIHSSFWNGAASIRDALMPKPGQSPHVRFRRAGMARGGDIFHAPPRDVCAILRGAAGGLDADQILAFNIEGHIAATLKTGGPNLNREANIAHVCDVFDELRESGEVNCRLATYMTQGYATRPLSAKAIRNLWRAGDVALVSVYPDGAIAAGEDLTSWVGGVLESAREGVGPGVKLIPNFRTVTGVRDQPYTPLKQEHFDAMLDAFNENECDEAFLWHSTWLGVEQHVGAVLDGMKALNAALVAREPKPEGAI